MRTCLMCTQKNKIHKFTGIISVNSFTRDFKEKIKQKIGSIIQPGTDNVNDKANMQKKDLKTTFPTHIICACTKNKNRN